MNTYLCTNGSNSSFTVLAKDAEKALELSVKYFDDNCDYILPITTVNVDDDADGATTEPDIDLDWEYDQDEIFEEAEKWFVQYGG